MSANPNNAFDYLVERILAKGCTPFIGAGMSNPAIKQGRRWSGHDVRTMVKKVLRATINTILKRLQWDERKVCDKCHSRFLNALSYKKHCPILAKEPCRLCDLRRISEQTRLAEACEVYVWEYGKLGQHNEPYKGLVEQLEIAEFSNLDPTPAHLYMAYIAREGLLNEFITTNYDCNLEKAYFATFGGCRSDVIDVISCLDEYTDLAGKRASPCPGEDTAHRIKVYKINGCAAKLTGRSDEAANILLTEAQLQNWRVRHWAEDLFRVKFRSTCITLVGFGNEEPQIRHTVQQVLEEYSHNSSWRKNSPSIFSRPNAPIVTMFDPYPSFPQRQLIHGYAHWMGLEGRDGESLLCGPQEFSARFPGANCNRLPADMLWQRLYQAVFRRLVVRALEHAAAKENAAFTGAVPDAGRLLRDIAGQWATTMDPSSHPLAVNDNRPLPMQPAWPPHLIGLLNRLLHGEDGHCRYTAVNDHQSLTAELVTLHWLLGRISGSEESVKSSWFKPVVCFELNTKDAGIHRRLFVSLDRDGRHRRQTAVRQELAPVALELCLGGDGARASAGVYRLFLDDAEGCMRAPLDVVRLAWRHLFPDDLPLYSVRSDLPLRLEDAMCRPTKYLRRAEPSIHRRPYLKEIVT